MELGRKQAALFVLCAVGMGCGGLPKAPRYPAPAASVGAQGLPDDGLEEPKLRPGDALVIEVGVGEEQQTREVVVDGRGELHVAAGQDVKVAGLSIAGAEARVTEVLRAADRFAEARLRFASGTRRQVSIIGALTRPGAIEFAPAMRVVDVLAAAGGVRTQAPRLDTPAYSVADLEGAVIVRDGIALPINLREAMAGTPGHNVYVRGGDYIYVPFATDDTVAVLGQVNSPQLLMHRNGLRLTEALSEAGGLTTGGDKSDIRLIRKRAGPRPKVYRASLRAIADGRTSDVVLAEGDVVFVQDDPAEDAAEVFDLIAPLATVMISALALFVVQSQL